MYRLVFILVLWLSVLTLSKADNRMVYVEKYAAIAISEMQRTGIPASIKLAQAVLESNAGQSILAIKANNHFGIKCGNDWGGKTFYREDDDRDDRGRLIKSCFRQFSSSQESYIAHSEFLRDPNKSYRYGSLFKLRSDDYRAWAKGLLNSGYATNPKYAQLLIKIIDDYQLYKYDVEIPRRAAEIVQVEEPTKNNTPEKRTKVPSTSSSYSTQLVKYKNDVKYVQAIPGDTPESIARKFKVSVHQVMKYNEELKSRTQEIAAATNVFIQPKRRKYRGKQKYHIVKSDELLTDISRNYGVCLSGLLKINRMNEGEDPESGQKIYLKGKNPKNVIVRTKYIKIDPISGHVDKNEYTSETQHVPIKEQVQESESMNGQQVEPAISKRIKHIVQPTETLYGIARAYGISIEKLKKLNNLVENTIHPGQELTIE